MINDDSVGTLGDGTGKRRIFTHDQMKKRCTRFLTKISVNHSPKEKYAVKKETKYNTKNTNQIKEKKQRETSTPIE